MREDEIQVGDIILYKLLPSNESTDPEQEHKARVKRKKFIEPDIWMIYIHVPGKLGAEWIFLNQVTRKAEE